MPGVMKGAVCSEIPGEVRAFSEKCGVNTVPGFEEMDTSTFLRPRFISDKLCSHCQERKRSSSAVQCCNVQRVIEYLSN